MVSTIRRFYTIQYSWRHCTKCHPVGRHVVHVDIMPCDQCVQVRIGVYDHGKAYTFDIHQPAFLKVKMSWIFLGISLISSIIVIPLFKFSPPK